MRSILVVAALTIFPAAANACWDETIDKCGSAELGVRRNTDTDGLPGQAYFNFLAGCAAAAIGDTVRCPGEKIRDGYEWTKEMAKDALRDMGYDARGIKLNVKSIGQTGDLADVRRKSLHLLHPDQISR